MNLGKTLFAQLMEFVPWTSFARIVARYSGDARVSALPSTEHFRNMAYAQLTWRESLRDVEATLGANTTKLYAIGLRQAVRRSTLADANERRNWRIWADFAAVLIRRANKLYADEPLGLDVNIAGNVYALDSSTIDLCLSLFDWAPFRRAKAAIKLHTLLDLRGSIPSFIHISDGKMGDVNVLDILPMEAGAFYIMDRGYLDFARLYAMHQAGAFFVTRVKSNFNARRVYSAKVEKATGVMCDQTMALNGYKSARDYPEHLRRVRFKYPLTGKTLIFLTNNTTLPAPVIAQLYKNRWQVELFFKWIKQHLRIKRFLGTSENAVKTQVWCPLIGSCPNPSWAFRPSVPSTGWTCRSYVRDTPEAMHEVYPKLMAPDTAWQVYREYYCPECGTMHDVEAPTPWYPVIHEFEPDIEAFYTDWVHLPLPEKTN